MGNPDGVPHPDSALREGGIEQVLIAVFALLLVRDSPSVLVEINPSRMPLQYRFGQILAPIVRRCAENGLAGEMQQRQSQYETLVHSMFL
jgi:hypothetical protein